MIEYADQNGKASLECAGCDTTLGATKGRVTAATDQSIDGEGGHQRDQHSSRYSHARHASRAQARARAGGTCGNLIAIAVSGATDGPTIAREISVIRNQIGTDASAAALTVGPVEGIVTVGRGCNLLQQLDSGTTGCY